MIAADVAVIAQLGHPLSADLLRLARDNAAYVGVFVSDVAFVEYLRPGLLLAVCYTSTICTMRRTRASWVNE
jgi:hypothetical protein